ncbi:MAG: TlpA disulfide reductase family protein [Bacillota bacterium]|nr:TlpA disulfide reductase family protein [Bacillota bacterium]
MHNNILKKTTAVVLAIVMLLGMASCQKNDNPTSSNTSSSEAQSTSPTGSQNADASSTDAQPSSTKEAHYFEDIELKNIDGTTAKLSEVAKENTIVVFWATWCHFCVKEIPILEELAKKEDVSIVLLNTGESKETVEAFKQSSKSPLTFYYDDQSVVAQKYGISAFPAIMFLSEKLEIIAYVRGKMEMDEFESALTKIKEFRTERGDFK